jgi:hypothetical protein
MAKRKLKGIFTIYCESGAVAALTLQNLGAINLQMQPDHKTWIGEMPNGLCVIARTEENCGIDNGTWLWERA